MHLRFSAIVVSAVLVLTSCAIRSQSGQSPSSPSTVTVTETLGPAAAAPAGPTVLTPVIGSVLAPPMPVAATDGKTHLAYELVLSNTLGQDVTLTSLAVKAGGATLLNLTGADLAERTRVMGEAATPTTTIGRAQTALVYLDVAVDNASGIPADVSHTIDISVPQPQPPLIEAMMTETIAPTTVDSRTPVTISPPLRGDNWLDGDSCCGMTAHRMAVSPLNGTLWAPERYAIDYVQLSSYGRMFSGDRGDLASYPYFGADVLAVADGPVVAVVEGLAEQVPGTNPQGLPLDQYAGNRVVQDIGGGNYVLYAHLKTGSIKVKVGDRLTTGQTLGSLGNTGNSDAPHLHFEVMNTPDPLRANGLPFLFDKFRLNSRIASTNALNHLSDTGGPAELKHGMTPRDETLVMPLVLDVMTYPAR
jgi:murein DD-endopeptidase MepM/ murein hydrolase activator NlpD